MSEVQSGGGRRQTGPARLRQFRFESLEPRRLLSADSEVLGRYLFYDNSKFDGQVAGPSAQDDAAIAPDKSAYLPGDGIAAASNFSSYSRGINGVMIDVSGSHPSLSIDDFQFFVGTDPDLIDSWQVAPATSGFTVRSGEGLNGSDRVTITWPSGAIANKWLEVIVAANDDTGLAETDRFFFGSRVGDTFAGSPPGLMITNVSDEIAARNNVGANIPISNALDFDRNGLVNVGDQIVARTNIGVLERIQIADDAPSISAELANDTAPGGTTNDDLLTSDPTVVATVLFPGGSGTLTAVLNGGAPVDVSSYLSGNTLTIDSALYELIGGGPLADGDHELRITAAGTHHQSAIAIVNFTLHTTTPQLTAASAVTISSDRTPHLTITASDDGLPLDQVLVDVDLNYDGDFDDLGELGYGTAGLYNGLGYFELNPALPANVAGAAYYVQIRTRADDAAGNEGTSAPLSLKIDTIGNTILEDYVNTADPSYSYSPANTITGSTYTAYILDMKSQTWRSTADVNKPLWQHWVQIIVPNSATPLTNTALMLIDGGSARATAPTSVNSQFAALASLTNSVVVVLPTVPNQPLIFTGDPGNSRSEDEIIAYTFRQYMDNLGAPGNETWPALLPMVKSAVAAMDTVQAYVPTVVSGGHIDDFVVTGYSKRGWTTWLTAAVDDRVRAIVPGVIDMLNLDEQMKHHYEFYGGFSPAINDYVGFNIIQESFTDAGQELGRVVDPYSYFANGRFDDMPKLMINASGDEFFVPDSAQYYFNDIPGTQNYLRYVPNSGHGVNSSIAGASTLAFFNAVVQNTALPEFSWSVRSDGQIAVDASTAPSNVVVWRATNTTSRDFRKSFTSVTWTSSTVPQSLDGLYRADPILPPGGGAHAFFVELTYPGGHVFTTEISVVDTFSTTPWPYFMPTNPPPVGVLVLDAGTATEGSGVDAVSFGLSVDTSAEPMNLTEPEPAIAAPATLVAAVAVRERAIAEYEFDDADSLAEVETEDDAFDLLLDALR